MIYTRIQVDWGGTIKWCLRVLVFRVPAIQGMTLYTHRGCALGGTTSGSSLAASIARWETLVWHAPKDSVLSAIFLEAIACWFWTETKTLDGLLLFILTSGIHSLLSSWSSTVLKSLECFCDKLFLRCLTSSSAAKVNPEHFDNTVERLFFLVLTKWAGWNCFPNLSFFKPKMHSLNHHWYRETSNTPTSTCRQSQSGVCYDRGVQACSTQHLWPPFEQKM